MLGVAAHKWSEDTGQTQHPPPDTVSQQGGIRDARSAGLERPPASAKSRLCNPLSSLPFLPASSHLK